MTNLLSITQAAKVLGKRRLTIYRWIQSGQIKAQEFVTGTFKTYGIEHDEVDRVLKEMQPPGWEALEA